MRLRRNDKQTKLHHGLITMVLMIGIMFYSIVGLGASPQVPLVLGCLVAGLVAVYVGYSWDELLEGILASIVDSLEAILILMLIGMIVASWIACGAVPTMIFYGLKIVSPKVFLPACMFICMIIALAIGSWGTVGTMGLAFLGMGMALQVPTPVIAGAIISGAYMGEIVSPLSDATNLTAAIVDKNVFSVVKATIPVTAAVAVICLIAYGILGIQYTGGAENDIEGSVAPLLEAMEQQFNISPMTLIPLLIMIICIVAKMPAIPAMLAGALVGMVEAAIVQSVSLSDIMKFSYSGYVSESGNQLIDSLLSAGGIEAMLEPISIIIIAMSFGGIMKKSRQMEALVGPIISRLNSLGKLNSLAAITCIVVNVIIPDQYLSISIPGQMYTDEYDAREIDKVSLGTTLLGSGGVTAPLIPWNTCGIYCGTIMACSPLAYSRYAFLSLLLPVTIILWQFISGVYQSGQRRA